MPSWRLGDYLTHRFNPELGIGRVTAIEGRALVVEFPRSGTTLRLAANTDALIPVDPDQQPGLERSLVERLISMLRPGVHGEGPVLPPAEGGSGATCGE